jgi:toxin-antitoxin system PIN domain toxin
MRALLDINVLLALLDEDHGFHDRAHAWFGHHVSLGWASCPLTENGLVRIRSHPHYHPVNRRSPSDVIAALGTFVSSGNHEFWPDLPTLRDPTRFDPSRILGPRQITDLYLLALATDRGGRLVTFDEGLNLAAVPRATKANLCVI